MVLRKPISWTLTLALMGSAMFFVSPVYGGGPGGVEILPRGTGEDNGPRTDPESEPGNDLSRIFDPGRTAQAQSKLMPPLLGEAYVKYRDLSINDGGFSGLRLAGAGKINTDPHIDHDIVLSADAQSSGLVFLVVGQRSGGGDLLSSFEQVNWMQAVPITRGQLGIANLRRLAHERLAGTGLDIAVGVLTLKNGTIHQAWAAFNADDVVASYDVLTLP